jgi:AraC-like DNA-binding protein
MPAFLLRGFWDELEKRVVSVRELERLSGVTRPRRGDFSSTVSEQDAYRLYEAALALTGDEALGVSVGDAMSVASLHLVGQLFVASVTLRQAIELAIRAEQHLRQRSLWLEDQPNGRVRLGHFSEQSGRPGARVDAEMTGVLMCKLAAHFLDYPSEVLTVQLPFPAPEDASTYLRVFPGGVQFDADGTFIVLPRVALDRRRSGVDPTLAHQLLQLAQDRYGTAQVGADSDWAHQVRRALRAQAAPRLVDPKALARQFGLSLRALSRRLAREEVSFSSLIDEALYERARALLRRPTASAKEVAAALGYAELSSFFRAFRRWSGGLTPTEYRQRAIRTTDGKDGAGDR